MCIKKVWIQNIFKIFFSNVSNQIAMFLNVTGIHPFMTLYPHSSSLPNIELEKLACVKGHETLIYITGITHISMYIHCQ